jgi:hypothetical protein
MIAAIRQENDLIPDSSLSQKLDQLENQCAEIFRAVYDKPHKAPQIRKFMEYYLPTTLKMVRGYRMLDERGITGTEAMDARNRIDDALVVVLQGLWPHTLLRFIMTLFYWKKTKSSAKKYI